MRTREVKQGFQPRIACCKDNDGHMFGEKNVIMERWEEYLEGC